MLVKAFTLIELLVVIAIIAILAVVVVLTLNPAQLLAESRDANRVSDMATLTSAIGLYTTDQSGASSFSLGTSSIVYVSVPDPQASSTCGYAGLPVMPYGYGYHCAATSTYRQASSTGWIPVNFQNISSGSPFGSLPIDPTNSTSSHLYYTYETSGSQFEVTAAMESTRYQPGGSSDPISGDGGPLATVYEKGTKLGLEPLDYGDPTLAAWWPMEEGSGTVAYDWSGNNDYLTLVNDTWTTGKFGNALNFGTSTSLGTATSGISLNQVSYSITAWVSFPLPTTPGGWRTLTRSSLTDHQILADSSGDLGVYDNTNNTGFHASGYNVSSLSGWHYLVAVGTGSNTLFYIDGAYVGTASYKSNAQINWVGNYGPGTQQFGTVEDLRVYTRALSGSAIQALYNGGK